MRVMSDKLDAGDTNTRKGSIRSITDAVEVDDRRLQGPSAARHHNLSPRRIGGKRLLTGEDWMIDVLVIA